MRRSVFKLTLVRLLHLARDMSVGWSWRCLKAWGEFFSVTTCSLSITFILCRLELAVLGGVGRVLQRHHLQPQHDVCPVDLHRSRHFLGRTFEHQGIERFLDLLPSGGLCLDGEMFSYAHHHWLAAVL